MDEIYTTEVYWFDSYKEAETAAIKMMAERPCLLQFWIDNRDKNHVKLTVGVGESR
jgi:hypothetical protein